MPARTGVPSGAPGDGGSARVPLAGVDRAVVAARAELAGGVEEAPVEVVAADVGHAQHLAVVQLAREVLALPGRAVAPPEEREHGPGPPDAAVARRRQADRRHAGERGGQAQDRDVRVGLPGPVVEARVHVDAPHAAQDPRAQGEDLAGEDPQLVGLGG
jgi:hypothetical protein